MTTVAYRDGVMCSDSQGTRGDFIDNTCFTKIYEAGGCLIGISGNAISARKFVEWFGEMANASLVQENNPHVQVGIPENLVEDNFHCLVAYPDKTCYEFFGCENVMECQGEYAAVGSGMQYALCAMDAGASAEEAVGVAIKRDVYSGGDIQKMTLEEEEEVSEEDVRNMSHEELLKFVLGEDEEPEGVEMPTCHEVFYTLVVDEDTELEITTEGEILWDKLHKSFGDSTFTRKFLLEIAHTLKVKYSHNISRDKLAAKLDAKIAEMLTDN